MDEQLPVFSRDATVQRIARYLRTASLDEAETHFLATGVQTQPQQFTISIIRNSIGRFRQENADYLERVRLVTMIIEDPTNPAIDHYIRDDNAWQQLGITQQTDAVDIQRDYNDWVQRQNRYLRVLEQFMNNPPLLDRLKWWIFETKDINAN